VQERTPIQLIVPDGTWRQARKIHSRHQELKDVQRVKIGTPNNLAFQLRTQSRPEGMATLLVDFTEGAHPISTKGTIEISGAKRRSDL
ncbi:MAG: DTW domain-containing protein, partial [Acidobacteria bacterium]|nr:DTW domain-containing protein [Acidobacteriota bacterium]